LSNDIRRSIATQKYLEKEFGLSPSPDTKQTKELPVYEMPKFRKEDINGVRFYIQDIVNNTLQKHKVRSFEELSKHLQQHHIEVKTVNYNGRIGVAYGISINKGYSSRFINGYTVHPQLSGPKLQKAFEVNRKSKLLLMVRKRLEKQLRTTYGLFKTINPEHLPDILKAYQKLDCSINFDERGEAINFSIYDKSGYVLNSEEIGFDIGIQQNRNLFESKYTQMYMESEQLELELQRCIKEAYQNSYLNSRNNILFSEHIDRMPIKGLVSEMAKSERFLFLKKYLNMDNQKLGKLIQHQIDLTKNKLCAVETIKEERELSSKVELIKDSIQKGLFDTPQQKDVLFELLRSLETRYENGTITYMNSYRHRIKLDLGYVPVAGKDECYASRGFIRENEKVLDGLLNNRFEKEIGLSQTAIFLPLIFPKLYDAMVPRYRQQFERISLKAYHTYAQRIQVSFEKSPSDYIKFFNAKGFYFERQEERLHICSIYSKYRVSVPLTPKTQSYLESSKELDRTLENQTTILEDIGTKGRDSLKNLWSTYLIERGQYKKAAYLFVLDGVRPNLTLEILERHMDKGLREALNTVAKIQVDIKQTRLLRTGIYALGNLLGGERPKSEEAFNGFKDELTDYSKYKGRGLSF
jgi:hypothetical protein